MIHRLWLMVWLINQKYRRDNIGGLVTNNEGSRYENRHVRMSTEHVIILCPMWIVTKRTLLGSRLPKTRWTI